MIHGCLIGNYGIGFLDDEEKEQILENSSNNF